MLSPEIFAFLRLSCISIGIGLLCLVKLLAFAQIYIAWNFYNQIYQQMKLRYQKPYKNAPNLCSACGDCLAKAFKPELHYDTELLKLPCGHFIHRICAGNLEYKAKCFYCEVTFFTYMIDWKQKSTLPYQYMMRFGATTRMRLLFYRRIPGIEKDYHSIRTELRDLASKEHKGGKLEWYMTFLPWILFKSFFSYDKLVPECKGLERCSYSSSDDKRKQSLYLKRDNFDKLLSKRRGPSLSAMNNWIIEEPDVIKREIWGSQRFNY